jgi:hypothetical protein
MVNFAATGSFRKGRELPCRTWKVFASSSGEMSFSLFGH